MSDLDLLVVGTGEAGTIAAEKAARSGLKVAIVDEAPYGGTCALRGCDPKKVLITASEALEQARRWSGSGIDMGSASINWQDLMKFKESFVEKVSTRREKSLASAGVTTLHGRAVFTAPDTIEIGDDKVTAEKFLIATGSSPRDLAIEGQELLLTSTDFLSLPEIPDEIIFIGGGYIAIEFAHLARRAGAKVQIVHRGTQMLKGFEPDIVEHLVQATRAAGIDVLLDSEVKAARKAGDGIELEVEVDQAEKTVSLKAKGAFHAAGRVPSVANLNVSAADVDVTTEGIVVNEFMQSTSNPRVYAAGDVAATGGAKLTPVAVAEGMIAASNIIKGNEKTVDYAGTPSVAFSVPALARVGLGEEEARAQGLEIEVKKKETGRWYNSRRTHEQSAAFKVIKEKGTGRILGAHLLGNHAEETINLFAMAIRHGISAGDLRKMPFAWPTMAADVVHMV